MLPFVLIALLESIAPIRQFMFTVLNPHCFDGGAVLDYWVVYHILEAGVVLGAVFLLTNLMDEFNIRLELIIAFVVSFGHEIET